MMKMLNKTQYETYIPELKFTKPQYKYKNMHILLYEKLFKTNIYYEK